MTQGRRERADAVRNRRAILLATEDLLTRYRPEEISMERVAAAAGVGKGTLFHRFGSRMGLMRALMQERALSLHDTVTNGPPPLGPGAPPRERLFAFLDSVIEVVSRNKGLVAALGHAVSTAHRPKGETNGDRSRGSGGNGGGGGTDEGSGLECAVGDERQGAAEAHRAQQGHPVYDFWSGHVGALVAEVRPDLDAGVLTHLLLSCLFNDRIQAMLERGEEQRVAAALHLLAGAALDSPQPPERSQAPEPGSG